MRIKKPARVIPRNYRVPTGVIPIPGAGHVAFEGTLERDFYLIMQFEPGFMAVESQPIRTEYEVNGRKHHYTPDVRKSREADRDSGVDPAEGSD